MSTVPSPAGTPPSSPALDPDVPVGAIASDRPGDDVRVEINRVRRGVTVVSVTGEVDLATADVFSSLVHAAVSAEAGGRVLLDLNGVTFLAARGLGVIVEADRDARRLGGALVMVADAVAPAVRSLRFLTPGPGPAVHATLADALADPPVERLD